MITRLAAVLWLVLTGLLLSTTGPSVAQSSIVIVSTTTSTQDSGLLDVLVPMFEKQTGLTVKTISVGTGQALALAARVDYAQPSLYAAACILILVVTPR